MASGIVRAAISSLLEREEYQLDTPRNVTARRTAKTLLEAIITDANIEIFDEFAAKLVDTITDIFPASAAPLSENVSERIMSNFHTLRVEKLGYLWQQLYSRLGWAETDPMLEQYASQVVFEKLMYSRFGGLTVPRKCAPALPLTADEENILRYVSGYVPFKLLKKFEVQSSRQAADYVECLSHMSVQGEIHDFPTYAMKWLEQVNRGGLFHVNDETYTLFRHIELKVREFLPRALLASAMPTSQTLSKEALLSLVVEDEDIQFQWSLLSVDVDEENNPNRLLNHMVDLWITIRAHALTGSWMEQFKSKLKSASKRKGTRKTLQRAEQDRTATSKEE